MDCRFFIGAFTAAIESVWGYLLYKYRDRLRKRRYIFISADAFLGLNLLRMAIQFGRYHRIQDTATYILYWFSISHFFIGLLCYLRDCIFVCSDSQQKSNGCESSHLLVCIIYISIYLLHPVVDSFFDMYEVRSRLSEVLLKISSGVAEEILYMICIIFIVVGI